MKVTIVQDAIVFVSEVTREAFDKAEKFCPEALTLYHKHEESKLKEPVCTIQVSCSGGSVNKNGIVFDSVTEDGKLCLTIAGITGVCADITAEEKKQCIVEEFSSLILNINALEKQIADALAAKSEEIEAALGSVKVFKI